MKYLHTMVRVTDIEASLRFYRDALGMEVLSRRDNEAGQFTLIFLAAPGDRAAQVELTYNWPKNGGGRDLHGRSQFWSHCLRGRQHLRHLPTLGRSRRHHLETAPRWTHGVCPVTRPDLH